MSALKRLLTNVGKGVRETGQTLERLGARAQDNYLWQHKICRHRPLMNLFDQRPQVPNTAFVAPNASIIGNVELYQEASVWYGAVLRGDQSNIVVGTRSSIGDRTVVQSCAVNPTGFSARTYIGSHVVIGKGCVLRGCTVDSGSMVGDGCVIQEGAVVESGAYLAPGSVLPVGALVPSGKIYAGNPATFVKDLEGEVDFAEKAEEMMELSRKHMEEYLPYSTAWQMYETHVKEGSVEMEGPKAKAAREGE